MSITLNKDAYMQLIQQDLDFLSKHCPDSPELDHIKLSVCKSIDYLYSEKSTNGFKPIETLNYEATGGRKFIGKNKYGCISTARISNSGIKSDDEAILPFTHWLPFL